MRGRRRRTACAIAALVLASAGCVPAKPSAERVVLVTIDTLRADHVGCYGAPRARTPALDRLASEGVRFDQAMSPAPLTLPSHATLLTGREPHEHGVRHNSIFELAAGVPTLSESLAARGLSGAAFVAAFVLDHRFGLARGFAVYDDQLGERRAGRTSFTFGERPANEVVDAALRWLVSAPERFFLWVHMYDPHAEYRPPPGFALAVPGAQPYDAEIAFADAQLGRLVAALDARWPEGTLIAVAADHGESLGEHGEKTHGYSIYPATQRVPLILRGAGLPAGAVVSSVVRLADVAPTLAAMAGAPPIPGASGRDLWPLVHGAEGGDRIATFETLAPQLDFGLSPLLGLRQGPLYYVRAPRPELFDVAADPGATRDLAAQRPDLVADLDAALSAQWSGAAPVQALHAPSAEERARLESLGYVVPEGLKETELGRVGGRDPKDFAGLPEALDEVGEMISAGRYAAALDVLGRYPDAGPRAARFRFYAALGAGDVGLAEKAAREVVASGTMPDGPVLLGSVLLRAGRVPEARAAFEAGRALDGASAAPLEGLARCADREGRHDEAEALFRQALEHEPESAVVRVGLAAFLIRRGRAVEADPLLAPLGDEVRSQPAFVLELASAERATGSRDAALERLKRAAAPQTAPPDVVLAYAAALEETGNAGALADVYERLLALEPGSAVYRNHLASALAQAGRELERALELAEGSTQELGRSPAALETLAAVRLARGEPALALEILDEALAKQPAPALRRALEARRDEAKRRLARS